MSKPNNLKLKRGISTCETELWQYNGVRRVSIEFDGSIGEVQKLREWLDKIQPWVRGEVS